MKRTCLFLLLATAALAQDDASTKYHEAYVLEVVDGKPAAAARAYLALMKDEKTPARIRRQAEFRFAVTCVLLGRADEARGRLAALAADTELPAGLRAQVEEYRKALAGVERGSALDKKLDELKFKLAQEGESHENPPVHREFEVLGEAAIPYLRRLTRHRDKVLRQQAVILLAKMDAPNLADVWTLADCNHNAIGEYFARHRDQLPAVIAKLEKAAPGEQRADALSLLEDVPLPLAWIEAHLDWPEVQDQIYSLLFSQKPDATTRAVMLRYIRGENVDLARSVARAYLSRLNHEGGEALLDGTVLLDVCRLLRRQGRDRQLPVLARASTTATLVRTLEAETKAGEMRHAQVAGAELLRRKELPQHEEVMRAWLFKAASKMGAPNTVTLGLRALVLRLPAAQAEAFVRRLFTEVAKGNPEQYSKVVGAERAEDVPLVLAAVEVAASDDLVSALISRAQAPFWKAFARVLPDMPARFPTHAGRWGWAFRVMAQHLPPAEAVAVGRKLIEATRALPEPKRTEVYGNLAWAPEHWDTYRERIVAPLLDVLERDASPALSQRLVHSGIYALEYGAGSARARYIALVKTHLEHGRSPFLQTKLASRQDDIPPEMWIPIRGYNARWANGLRPGWQVRTFRYFVEHPDVINGHVALFLAKYEAPRRADLLAPLFRSDDVRLLRLLFTHKLHEHVKLSALEPMLANDKLPIDLQAGVGQRFARERPTEALFPLVRRVLAAKDRETVERGIQMAHSLGSEKLLPDLSRLLDTLDARVRDKANDAIQSIVELRKLKAELRADIAGK